MARTQTTVRIRRPAAVVFQAIEQHGWTNEPAWEPEVIEVRPLEAGRPRVGSRAAMTRKDSGRVHTTTFEFTALEPPTRLALRHVDGPMDFALEFRLAPVGSSATDVTVTVDMAPRGALRLMAPVFALMGPRRNARISAAMVKAIEASTEPAAAGEALAPA
jgi:uncharacterized protein YndB with AHSA1/START domain